MTQENKQLLLKDLCARLPYSVFGLHRGEDLPLYAIDDSGAYMVLGYDAWFDLDTILFKPYLRPLSSMTEEEKKEYELFSNSVKSFYGRTAESNACVELVEWLNAHQFDYRIDPFTGKTLIESNLAIEAPKDMYKNE